MIAKEYAILSTWGDSSANDIGNGYIREFIKNGAVYIDYEDLYLKFGHKRIQDVISSIIDENDIRVLIYQSGPSDFHFSVEFFRTLREKVFTVMMVGDSNHYFDMRDIYYAQAMDLVADYDCLSRYRFQQYGIESVSFYSSYDKNKYFKIHNINRNIDVSFVGLLSAKKERKKSIEYIIGNNINVEVFGAGSKNGQVSLEKMVEIFNRTKINLNFTDVSVKNALRREPNINSRVRRLKGRIAEICLCGGFVLSEYAPGIEEVFEVDREIVVFRSREEMVEKIKYYLEHENKRETIADNGYMRALRDYEIGKAIPEFINRIEAFRKYKTHKPTQIYLDEDFVKYYTTFRIRMMVKFARLGKWRFFLQELGIILKSRRLDFNRTAKFLLDTFPEFKKLLKRIFQLKTTFVCNRAVD